jgi:predicted enzyme related to lactoylglutathione lyase
MFVRIDHVEIVPQDFERSLTFYQEVLGFRMVQRMTLPEGPLKEIAFLQLGDGVIEVMHYESVAPSPEAPAVGFRAMALEVQSMDEAVAALKKHGVAVTWGPVDLGGSIRAEITDPDGLVIELRQWQQRSW